MGHQRSRVGEGAVNHILFILLPSQLFHAMSTSLSTPPFPATSAVRFDYEQSLAETGESRTQ